MALNHLNLPVADAPGLSAFLEKFSSMECLGGNDGMAFLGDGQGFTLTLMKAKGGVAEYPGFFHLGFFGGDEKSIDGLYERLVEAGYECT